MAPEQTLGEPPTSAADVFALGIIAWELFTGLPLYRGTDIKAILEAVRRSVPPRIDGLNPAVPVEIADAIARALSRDQTARGTAADLLAACARTALLGGAHALAAWLTALDEASDSQLGSRPQRSSRSSPSGLAPESASVPRASTSVASSLPAREPTQSLASAAIPSPPDDFGAGTPGFIEPPAARPAPAARSTAADEPPGRTTTGVRFVGFDQDGTTTSAQARPWHRVPTTVPAVQRFGDRDPTGTAPAGSAPGAWGHEATSAGVGRLADALPSERDPTAAVDDPLEAAPLERPSYATLVMAPGVSPANLRFDDEATQHAFAAPVMPAAVEQTRFDDLLLDPIVDPSRPSSSPGRRTSRSMMT